MESLKHINLKKIFYWGVVILWMALIFYLSHQPVEKSNNLSKEITEIIIETIEKVVPSKKFDLRTLNHILRKNAHFFAYFILGILVLNALRVSSINGFNGIILTLMICILYAISDEVHQLFVPGRGGQVRDVIIDSAGAIAGIFGYKGLSVIRSKKYNINKYRTRG